MSVVVRGMEMPKNCLECPCLRTDVGGIKDAFCCNVTLRIIREGDMPKPKDCPLFELKYWRKIK